MDYFGNSYRRKEAKENEDDQRVFKEVDPKEFTGRTDGMDLSYDSDEDEEFLEEEKLGFFSDAVLAKYYRKYGTKFSFTDGRYRGRNLIPHWKKCNSKHQSETNEHGAISFEVDPTVFEKMNQRKDEEKEDTPPPPPLTPPAEPRRRYNSITCLFFLISLITSIPSIYLFLQHILPSTDGDISNNVTSNITE